MSGHSKWSTIKHKKAASDAKRGVLFTKLTREVMLAARIGGPDPEMNFRLRLVIQNARAANMPTDNIDRAISKGYGPGGAAILIQALTDNRKRTVSDVRSRLSKSGGNLAETGAVAWGFATKGTIIVDIDDGDPEEVALEAVDSGVEDFDIVGNTIQFTTAPGDLERLRGALEEMAGVKVQSADLAMVPKNMLELGDSTAKQTLRLLESLEELDDVQKVYSNADFSDEVLASFSGAS